MVAKNVLKESAGIRRTRSGDILIQLKMGSDVREIADKLNEALGGKVHVPPMQDKVSVEMKNIDPLVSKGELIYDIERDLEINDIRDVKIKTTRLAPWGTQSAIVVMPKASINKVDADSKIRTGLTIATMRVLPKIIKCFSCHMFRLTSYKCTMLSPGRELCRKCGARDHVIANCPNAPCYAICSKETGVRMNHVTGSLACPKYRKILGQGNRGRL
jgi:hypothetical protein